ncbi:FKBP-type peptidyl-prolyl cis-trans isomerase [Treponema primitia]|uniref:FKBP-type peptidyl-prolyl cis-trans isomerase n=1 Tax=Treponema primitia TaxID=88058 RepID=UPI0002554FF0|nr:FKBP-type peptidyl-prolyl cis-trans isomerase [Treponema primitia]
MLKKVVFSLLVATNVLFACNAKGVSDRNSDANANSADADTSYAFGVALGSDFKQAGLSFDYDALIKGFRDTLEGKETRITLEEAIPLIQTAMRDAMTKVAEENKQKGLDFLTENGKKPGITTTSSGLQYEIISSGTGPKPQSFNTVSVNYEGTLMDGTVFDSSYDRGEPTEFPLDQVIPGWTEGIQLMEVGSTYRLFIPSDLAYGEQGVQNFIPPHSTLIFKVELLGILE